MAYWIAVFVWITVGSVSAVFLLRLFGFELAVEHALAPAAAGALIASVRTLVLEIKKRFKR